MNVNDVEAIHRLRRLRPMIIHVGLSPSTATKLVQATYDRAVLLPDIADAVLTGHLGVGPEEMAKVHQVQAVVIQECAQELNVRGRFLPFVVPYVAANGQQANTSALRPRTWSWLELLSAGVTLSGQQFAACLDVIFNENAYVDSTNKAFSEEARVHKKKEAQKELFTFAERCAQSGCSQYIPCVDVATSSKATHVRKVRGTPKMRILEARVTPSVLQARAWRFQGHLEQELAIRTQLQSVVGSWQSIQSECRCWGVFMDRYHKFEPHFPVRFAALAGYVNFFDASSTCAKYVQAIRKASLLMDAPWPEQASVKSLLKGASKFAVQQKKSYIVGNQVGILVDELCKIERVPLARLIAVAYTYSLRAQSEAFPLEVGVRDRRGSGDSWHSEVTVREASVAITLRRRKNCQLPSVVERACICKLWPQRYICGVCALRQAIAVKPKGVSKLFGDVKPSDISVVRDIAAAHGFGRITWHGLRRGRTVDVLNGLDLKDNPALSLAELFESGGWTPGSRSIFSYVPTGQANAHRLVKDVVEGSDSE